MGPEPLYPDPASWEREYQAVESDLEKVGDFKGTLGRSLDDLLAALRHLEAVQLRLERLGEYASLLHAQDESDASRAGDDGTLHDAGYQSEGEWSWMDPEIQAIPETSFDRGWKTRGWQNSVSYLGKLLRFKPHILSEKEERILALQQEATATARDAFSLLTNVDLDFGTVDTPDGSVGLSQTSFSWFLQHADRSVRERAYKAFYAKFEEHKQTLAALYSGSVKLDRYLATVRNFPSSARAPSSPTRWMRPSTTPSSPRSTRIYRSCTAITPSRPRSQARWPQALGRLRPLVGGVKTDYPYDRAVDTVCAPSRPWARNMSIPFALDSWADGWTAMRNKGKRSGLQFRFLAQAPLHPPQLPAGRLARPVHHGHEGGHFMHSWYSGAANPFMCWSYTIFEAEVASTFNEELLFRHL
jgi:oligoendopeptidase F